MFINFKTWFWVGMVSFNAFIAYNYYDVAQCLDREERMCFTLLTFFLSIFAPLAKLIFRNLFSFIDKDYEFLSINIIIVAFFNVFVLTVAMILRRIFQRRV